MSDAPFRSLIDDYLRQVEQALYDLPPAQRREILDDLEAHIRDALAASPGTDESDVRSLLERLGPPDDLARAARERAESPGPPMAISHRRVGLLEAVAVVATAVCWPVGILLAWLSDSWRRRDKVIATVLPISGLVLALLMVLPASVAIVTGSATPMTPGDVVFGPQSTVSVPQQTPGAMPTPDVVVVGQEVRGGLGVVEVFLLLFVLFGTPLVSAAYLAAQLRRPLVDQDSPGVTAGNARRESGYASPQT